MFHGINHGFSNNGIPSHNLMASLVGISAWDDNIDKITWGELNGKYMEHPTGNPWDAISTIWL